MNCKIGDTGPAGGVIFYVDTTVTPPRAYEAWTADESGTYSWSTSLEWVGDSTDVVIGSGHYNTYNSLSGTEFPAAAQARSANHGGFDDWFLPSRNELNEIWKERAEVGGFDPELYWTSSEYSNDRAWYQNFNNGDQNFSFKTSIGRVRVARSFPMCPTPIPGPQGPAGSDPPAGVIHAFAGDTIPSGWLVCDGSEVSRTTYSTLFAVLGDKWGDGDGTTTFNLPDMVIGYFPNSSLISQGFAVAFQGLSGAISGEGFPKADKPIGINCVIKY